MNRINYQRQLDDVLEELKRTGRRPRLLLHCCCAPCASYVLEYLSPYFEIGLYYYNPNIFPREEYDKRLGELIRLVEEMGLGEHVSLIPAPYAPEEFFAAAKGLETAPEGGERCTRCFTLRLGAAARAAKVFCADYLCTTLTISPLKDAERLNRLGNTAAEEAGVRWLPSDFKKRGGYQRSIELSRIYGLYRQNYCGCVYSRP